MLALLLGASICHPNEPSGVVSFQVESGTGLTVSLDGVPLIEGSWFQYYEPGWSKAYYSSTGRTQKVEKISDQKYRVTYDAGDGGARGSQTYELDGDHLKVHCEFDWDGEHPVNVEATAAAIWAPAVENGTLSGDGKPTRSLSSYLYRGNDIEARRFGPNAGTYSVTAPLGTITETSSQPLTLFDARGGYRQDWAEGRQLWWLGAFALIAEKDKPAVLDLDWRFDAKPAAPTSAANVSLTGRASAEALSPDTSRPPLIPDPRFNKLDWDHPLALTGAFSFPAGVFEHLDEFQAALARRFEMPVVTAKTPKIAMDAGISKLGDVPGGYRITIRLDGLTVLGEEDEGLRFGLERVASLAFVKDGKVMLPTGTLSDQPKSNWRGVHLFVGPKAVEFQDRLWTRVLRPLGFNKVVLQCERTAWDSVPGIETKITMSKSDLIRLFAMYRRLGIDPIPLIESYGHMEWLFENGKNLDIAYNPAEPYTVDPRKPETATLLSKLWDEVITSLHPATIHFGLDEVDMVGFKKDPVLETKLWTTQLGLLGGIARTHDVQMMLWGDQALAPNEAPDAAMADDKATAAARRAVIPKGALIGDWHYINEPDYRKYTNNLQLWKDLGLVPIATTWYQPGNIQGFDVDASLLGVGTLQTTWAGYESNEEAMLDAMPQFSALVLAADYGWSGRNDELKELGYDPAEVFRKMYFGRPSPLVAKGGTDLSSGNAEGFTVGPVKYGSALNLSLASNIVTTDGAASSLDLSVQGKGSELAIAMETLAPGKDGDPVADLTIELAGGGKIVKHLKYGEQVRAMTDKGPMAIADRNSDGVCSLRVDLGTTAQQVRRISFKPLNSYTGLKVLGLELID